MDEDQSVFAPIRPIVAPVELSPTKLIPARQGTARRSMWAVFAARMQVALKIGTLLMLLAAGAAIMLTLGMGAG